MMPAHRKSQYLGLLWLVLGLGASVPAAEYEVDGEIQNVVFTARGDVQFMEQNRFTVFVRGCSWLIRTTNFDKGGKPRTVRETGCSNGTEVYEVMGRAEPSDRSRGFNVGSIISNSVPIGTMEGYCVSHLWLMFASGCYFANLSSNQIPPVFDPNASVAVDPTLRREAKWELVAGLGSLPLSVVYLDRGDTNATYMATGTTNAGGTLLPNGFVFEWRTGMRFVPGPFGAAESNATYRIRERVTATVTAVRPGCTLANLLPSAAGRTIITDRRLTNAALYLPTYAVQTGAHWVPVEQARKMYLSKPAAQERSPAAAVVVCGLLLGSSALLLFFLISNKWK